MRVFGFSAAQQKIMSDFKRNKQTIHLDDCQVTQARIGCKMEVMLKGSTKISDHPTVSRLEFEDNTPAIISLWDLESKNA